MKGLRLVAAVLVGSAMISVRGARSEDAPGGATGGSQPMPPGCAKIVAVLEEGSGLSADEVAKKTNTDVETVRNCTDLWRRGMKGGAKP